MSRPELPSLELLNELETRYASTKVPPCRVCGAELGIAAMGGGAATKWACADRPRVAGEMDAWYDHYRDSQWTQTQYGDSDVRELVAFVRILRENEVTEFALDNEYDVPRPLSHQDLQEHDWLQAMLNRGLRLVKRRTVTYQTAWDSASENDLPNGS